MIAAAPRRLRRAAACAAVAVASTAAVAQAAEPGVPTEIRIAEGNKLYLEAHATGVQIYDCVAAGGGHAWSAATPRADLFGRNGKRIGIHYGGPTWETKDGSKVVAKRDAGVTVDPTAIPWLLLKTTSAAAGPGGDRLARTTYIQRVNTGGVAPNGGICDPTVDKEARVRYTADYYFWKATGPGAP